MTWCLHPRGLDADGMPDGHYVVSIAGNRVVGWVVEAANPTTTKGDLITNDGTGAVRLAVGTDGYVLTADSTAPDGIAWEAATSGFADPLTTKGDLIVRTTSATTRKAVGTNGYVLTADSTSADGVAWAAAAGGAAWTSAINDPLSSMTNLKTPLSGTWAINSGVLRQSDTTAAQRRVSHNTSVIPAGVRATEVEMAYVGGSGSTRRMGLIVSSSNVTSGNLVIYAQSAAGTSWTVTVEQDGVTAYYTSGTISYAGTGYLRLGAVMSGGVLDIYLGGVWLASVKASSFTAGPWVGLYTYGLSGDFKNLKAWSMLTSPF